MTKILVTSRADKDIEQLHISHMLVEMQNGKAILENSLAISYKHKCTLDT